MSFLTPLFLLGAAALAAPFLVHLVRRTRARRVEFPALMFVRQVPQRSVRRQKLHNLLLLLLRSLGLLLIVLAFTRPFFSGSNAADASGQRRASVILLDTSLSMRYGDRFEAAKKQALAIIDSARADEQLALIGFGQSYEIVNRFGADRGAIKSALAALKTSDGATDYVQAVKGAEALLKAQGEGGFQRIFLISDLQATNWQDKNSSFRLPEDLRPRGFGRGAECGIESCSHQCQCARRRLRRKVPGGAHRTINNFSETARDRVEVTFQINDQTVDRREINLGARDQAVLEFTGFNLAAGANRCAISVSADDFTPDDSFYFTVRREEPVGALVMETAVRGTSESLFLSQALTTGEGLPFAISVKSAGSVDPERVGNYGLIILNDVGTLNGRLIAALRGYLMSGGKLMVGVGPHTEAEDFNNAFADIAPAKLVGAAKRSRQDAIALGDVQLNHPIFQIFRDGGQLAPLKVFGYHRTEPRPNSEVIARYADGSPAIIEGTVNSAGKFLLYTSTFDASWSDLPLTRLYLPLVQQMARHLSERQEKSWHLLGETFTAQPSIVGGKSELPAVDAPGGERLTERALTAKGDLLVSAREPGFYRLRYTPAPHYAAANIDRLESDFSKLDLDEFTNSFRASGVGGRELAPGAEKPQLSDAEVEAKQKVWWPLLAAALMLFIAEAILARKTKMARMIG
ncbi:MAG: VWA domain-containing protein [Pyrinomonadaceae bacterium]